MSTGFIHNFQEDEKTDFVRFRETFLKIRETRRKKAL